jgi:addiction module RelE/StbE family toxin
MEVNWSPKSIEKLKSIFDHIAQDSPGAAQTFVDRLIQSVDRLASFPYSGQVLLVNPAFRQLVFKNYLIVYRIKLNVVEVVTIFYPKEKALL